MPLLCPTILRRLDEVQAAAERRGELERANSELERLNRELRESDKLKNALVAQQAVEIGDWIWNMKTGENIWSEPVEVMHGLAPGTYDGRYESWWATVHPDDRAIVTEALKRAQETGEYEVEYRTLRPDRSTYWTAARGRVIIGDDGQPERMIGICMDVTSRKANEQALLRAEKLAAAGRLAATVAHEINNPLEAVTNLVYLARMPGSDVDKVLALAERELARVSAIARQTLSFYRDTASPTEFPAAEVVDQVLEIYSGKLGARHLSVQKQIESAATIRAPRGNLHQIFANLLSNAVDASPFGGTIHIRLFDDTEGFTIEIADEGSGIAEESARHLFEPFFTTKKDVGTGLGLWVSRRLAEQMGGTISYSSKDGASGKGATFRIHLGRAEKAQQPYSAV
jgi:PAS domain S-box-containing protein